MVADWGSNHYTPGPPGPELVLLLGVAGLAVGWVLSVLIGLWWTLAWVGVVAAASGLYLLLHRIRYGRWTP